MRITAVFDRDGTILAAVELVEGYAGPVPVATKDTESTGTFEVADTTRDLAELCTNMRVDVSAKALVAR